MPSFSMYRAGLCPLLIAVSMTPCWAGNYPVVDTGQVRCFDNRFEIEYPRPGEPFFGQDAQYLGNQPAYRDNGDGTTTDLVTGLMWQQDPGPKKTFDEAVAGAAACRVGGYDDWRLPSIKELYSLVLFSGEDVNPLATRTAGLTPFIDTRYFHFTYGDPARGERIIDSQAATSTKYVSTTMRGSETMFGVNFADGRIKGYPVRRGPRGVPKYYVFYVRGNPGYGKNDFHDNGDGTITDRATGLCWFKYDSGHRQAGPNKNGLLNWEEALRWAERLEYAGYSDWRLPNAKELQSIVDYTRSPDTTKSAAIDPVFQSTPIRDALGRVDYGFYWTSTTHKWRGAGDTAVYIAFGRSPGWMPGPGGRRVLLDVHGAGSQRSDPKAGDPARFPYGRGPQGDVIRIDNLVRPVRGGKATLQRKGPAPQSASRPGKKPEPESSRGGRLGAPKPSRTTPGESMAKRPGRRPRTAADVIKRLDRDGDGRISSQEFNGPAPAFHRNDRDGDGYLSEDEIPRRRLQGGQPLRTPERTGRAESGLPRRTTRPRAERKASGRPPAGSQQKAAASGVVPEGDAAVTLRQAETVAGSTKVRADAAWRKLPPSFVFILADDMGWTGLSVPMDDRVAESRSGYYQTPHIASLARRRDAVTRT